MNTPSPESLAAMIESIRLHYDDHEEAFGAAEQKLVDSLPVRNYVINEMNDAQRGVLFRNIRHLWVGITGKEPDATQGSAEAHNLNGSYWMLPGGVLVSGFNHFQAAKDNRLMICALLDINPIVFEKMVGAGNPHDVISLILARGGVRVIIDRDSSTVTMQTNEDSWLWVKDKLERMWHKNKIAKVLDLSKSYEGWESGVTIRVK